MQKFINAIIDNTILRSSDIFDFFITSPREDFLKNKEKYDKLEQPKSLKKLINYDGFINIALNEEVIKTAENISVDLYKKQSLLQSLNNGIKDVIYTIGLLSEKLNNLSNIFETLEKNYTVNTDSLDNISQSFAHLKELMKNWSNNYQQQLNFFKFDVRYFFKFMKNEFIEFRKFYDEYNSAKSTYNEYKNENDTNQEKIMIKSYCGYCANKLIELYQILNNNHYERLQNNFDISDTNKEIFYEGYTTFLQLLSNPI